MADEEEIGAAWLEEGDVDLDRFMQEDALLDAIQNVPGLELEQLEQQPPVVPYVVNGASGSAFGGSSSSISPAEPEGSLCTDTTALLHEEPLGGGSADWRPEVTHGVARSSEHHAGPRKPRAAAGATLGSRPPGVPVPRSRPVPWRGVALLAVTIWSMFYFGLGLFEHDDPSKLVPAGLAAVAADPRPIQLPAAGTFADEEGGSGNGTAAGAFGVRRGKIAVKWSSDSATNMSAMALLRSQGANSTSADAAAEAASRRADRGRRGRSRGRGVGTDPDPR